MRFAVLLDFKWQYCGDFYLRCDIAVLQNQAVCGIWKFSAKFNAVWGFLCYYVRCIYVILCGFAIFVPPLRSPRIREGGTDGDKKEKKAPDHTH